MKFTVKAVQHCACGAEILVLRFRGPRTSCMACVKRAAQARFKLAHPNRKRELNQKWSEVNREKDRAAKAAWQKRNPENGAAKAARWRAANPERARAVNLRYYRNNREHCIQLVQNRTAAFRTPPWADLGAIANMYSQARRMTIETGIEHQVDHIVPRMGKNVCGLHVETNLSVITAYENRIKSNKFQEGNP